jgi:hypothetical protein
MACFQKLAGTNMSQMRAFADRQEARFGLEPKALTNNFCLFRSQAFHATT